MATNAELSQEVHALKTTVDELTSKVETLTANIAVLDQEKLAGVDLLNISERVAVLESVEKVSANGFTEAEHASIILVLRKYFSNDMVEEFVSNGE